MATTRSCCAIGAATAALLPLRIGGCHRLDSPGTRTNSASVPELPCGEFPPRGENAAAIGSTRHRCLRRDVMLGGFAKPATVVMAIPGIPTFRRHEPLTYVVVAKTMNRATGRV